MPGAYAAPYEGLAEGYDPYATPDDESLSTHSSDYQTSTPDTLTTPPEKRRHHPHRLPRVKNPAAWPRDPNYVHPGPESSSGTWS